MPTLFTCPTQISFPAFLNFSRITFSPTITQVRCQTLGMRKWIIFFGCAPLTVKNTKGKQKQPLSQSAYKKIDILIKSAKGKRFPKWSLLYFMYSINELFCNKLYWNRRTFTNDRKLPANMDTFNSCRKVLFWRSKSTCRAPMIFDRPWKIELKFIRIWIHKIL